MGRAKATASLIPCSFPPFYIREAMDFVLGFIGEISESVPCFELGVVPDKKVVEFIIEQAAAAN